ncbi:E3 ubiquitin-protein ligase RNF180 [Fundulus diaphanus]
MDGTTLRCRRCRRTVIDSTCLLTAADESPAAGCSIWHIDADNLPEWILSSVQQALWTAGKLNCHHCGARLGGFNFLGRSDCPCGRGAAVHLSKSRVDLDHKRRVLLVQPGRSETGQADLLADLCQRREEATLDGSRLARLPRLAPVDPPGAGGNSQRDAAGLADTPESASSVRHPAELQSDSDGEAWSDVLPWVPDIPGGSSLSVELQQTGDVCLRRRHTSGGGAGLEEEEEEFSSQDRELSSLSARIRRSKRDKNRLKSLRRKQRRRERWLQSQMKEDESDSGTDLDSVDVDRDGLSCSVCLDVFFSPYACRPCAHVFCEPCLRTLAKNRAADTPCPLCRRVVSHCSLHRELDQTTKTRFPKVWARRRQNFQNAPCARWPLPGSREHSRFFWVNRRSAATAWRRWRFTPGAFGFNVLGLPQHTFFHMDTILLIFALKLLCCLSVLLCKYIF